MARYSEVRTRLDTRTNVLHVQYLGGRLDGVTVAIEDRELRRDPYGQNFLPVDVDALAKELLSPASEAVIEGAYAVVEPTRLALLP